MMPNPKMMFFRTLDNCVKRRTSSYTLFVTDARETAKDSRDCITKMWTTYTAGLFTLPTTQKFHGSFCQSNHTKTGSKNQHANFIDCAFAWLNHSKTGPL